MKTLIHNTAVFALISSSVCLAAERIPNPLIDAQAFVRIVKESQSPRQKNRLSEADFLKAMRSGEYVLLDARSAANYALRHIEGAVNLPFTEFTAESLARVIPKPSSNILIYCNNNFQGSPVSFESKSPAASLNLSTQVALVTYGYKNIFELGPLLNVEKTVLPFGGVEVSSRQQAVQR
ncbi:MAG: hypothetical protein ACI9X0_000639 [Kiritimatiellia bacterium]|jgi:hypothetical protein